MNRKTEKQHTSLEVQQKQRKLLETKRDNSSTQSNDSSPIEIETSTDSNRTQLLGFACLHMSGLC